MISQLQSPSPHLPEAGGAGAGPRLQTAPCGRAAQRGETRITAAAQTHAHPEELCQNTTVLAWCRT